MNGIELIKAECDRHVTEKGWTPEHDDTHTECELATAASIYAAAAVELIAGGSPEELMTDVREADSRPPEERIWPFENSSFKLVADPKRALVKAGSLIVAELNRLLRAEDRLQQEINERDAAQ